MKINRCEKDGLLYGLPSVRPYNRRLGHDYGFSDQYGAFQVAARYCNVLNNYPFPGIWQHGCFGPWDQVSPGAILYHSPSIGEKSAFVARMDERELLRNQGVYNVHAIGLPFVYLSDVHEARMKDSLLVVPSHSIKGQPSFKKRKQLRQYAALINEIREQFAQVVVCLHYGDLCNNYWVQEFSEYDIPYVLGAVPHDSNSLLRIKMLFSRFEYVTTNSWGSHVAYALACGAKLSIWGDPPERDVSVQEKDLGAGGSDNIKLRSAPEVLRKRSNYLSKFFTIPRNGVCDPSVGLRLIGQENRCHPDELMDLFQWSSVNFGVRVRITLSRSKEDVLSKGGSVKRNLISKIGRLVKLPLIDKRNKSVERL